MQNTLFEFITFSILVIFLGKIGYLIEDIRNILRSLLNSNDSK